MSFRNTAILAVVVALFAGYLYWVERPAVEEESRTRHILDFDPADVTALELRTPHETVKVEKTADDQWRIVAPIDGPADARAIDTLLRTAAEAERKRAVSDGSGDLTAFGLETPDAEIRLQTAAGPLPALAIGKGTPIGFNAYARRGDDASVLLTGGTVRTALVKNLVDLRDKEILHLAEGDVTALTLRPQGGPEVRLERRQGDDGGWRLGDPIEARAADTAVRNLLGSLRALRAVDFVNESGPEAEASRGLSPAALEVVIETTSDPIEVRVGDPVDLADKKLVALAVSGSPQIYLVASHVPASLGKTAADLRDKTIVDTGAEEVVRIRIHRDDGDDFELTRHDQRWSLSGDDATDELVAKRFVDDLLGLTGDQISTETNDLTHGGLDRPMIEAALLDGDGGPIGNVVIGREIVEDRPVYRAALKGRGPVYTIPDYVYSRLDKRPEALTVRSDDTPSPAAGGAPAAEAPSSETP